MVKQEKKYIFNNKKFFRFNILQKKRCKKKLRRFRRLKRHYKFKRYYYLYIKRSLVYKKYTTLLSIVVRSNNIFCHLRSIKEKKTLFKSSSGLFRVKVSKKTLRYVTKTVLFLFFKKVRRYLKSGVILCVTSSSRDKKPLLKILKTFLRKRLVLLKVLEKKIFNGCRPCKQRRKKRKGLRILK